MDFNNKEAIIKLLPFSTKQKRGINQAGLFSSYVYGFLLWEGCKILS